MITVHLNNAKRRLDIFKLLSMSDGRIGRRNERLTCTWWTILSMKQLLKKIGDNDFRTSRRALYKLADELRVNPDTCGRANSI